ncbi:MAG: alpha/beta fold hydrolase [Castellaniella sp.]
MSVEIVVPASGGEYMESVVVVKWHAGVGDSVRTGQLLVAVETAKTAIDIEAPQDGILSEILAQEGDEIRIGAVLARLDTGTAATPASTAVPPRITASPAARRRARELGLDLAGIPPSSPSGRIKLRDLPDIQPATSMTHTDARAGRHVDIDTDTLYIQTRGAKTGIPVVFLHGLGDDATGWTPLLSRLRTHHPLIVLDLPGHGRSLAHPASDLPALAQAVTQALQAQPGLTQFHLVGHSLGGAVAILMARTGLFDIHSLGLLAPAGLGPEIHSDILRALLDTTDARKLGKALHRLVARPDVIDETLIALAAQARMNPMLRERQLALARSLFDDNRQAHDLRALLQGLGLPGKIIWGREDAVIPWQHALSLDGHMAVHLLPGVGHVPQLEAPDLTADLLQELFRSAP